MEVKATSADDNDDNDDPVVRESLMPDAEQ